MKIKKIKFIIPIVLTLVIVTYSAFKYFTNPMYSISQVSKSIKNHDLENFQYYVDTDNILNSLIDQLIDVQKKLNINTSTNQWENLGQNLAEQLIKVLRPQLTQNFKHELNKYIESGNFENKKEENVSLKDLNNRVFLNNDIKIKNIQYEGKICIVNILINNKKYNKDLEFHLKMRKKGYHWQISDFPNFGETLVKIDEFENDRITELNKPIVKKFNDIFTFSDCIKNNYSKDKWNINKYSKIKCKIVNKDNDIIKQIYGIVSIKDKKGRINPIITDLKITNFPVDSWGDWTSEKNINPFINEDVIFYNLPISDLDINLSIESIEMENSGIIAIYKKYK